MKKNIYISIETYTISNEVTISCVQQWLYFQKSYVVFVLSDNNMDHYQETMFPVNNDSKWMTSCSQL